MTRQTGEDEMSEMTDERAAEVLENIRLGVEMDRHCLDDGQARLDALDHAVSRLLAQPPAEAQPVLWQFQDRDGKWHGFMDERHRQNTIADGSWPVRALYTAPVAPVGVEGFDEWIDEYTKNNYTDEMLALAAWEAALAQQPAAVECDCPIGQAEHMSWCAISKAQDAQHGGRSDD